MRYGFGGNFVLESAAVSESGAEVVMRCNQANSTAMRAKPHHLFLYCSQAALQRVWWQGLRLRHWSLALCRDLLVIISFPPSFHSHLLLHPSIHPSIYPPITHHPSPSSSNQLLGIDSINALSLSFSLSLFALFLDWFVALVVCWCLE
jgi:hypothetical protein